MLMLSACSTVPVKPPVIVTNICNPPTEFMVKHNDLAKIQGTTITEKQLIDLMLDDTQQYNTLNIDHSALIDWVNTHCK